MNFFPVTLRGFRKTRMAPRICATFSHDVDRISTLRKTLARRVPSWQQQQSEVLEISLEFNGLKDQCQGLISRIHIHTSFGVFARINITVRPVVGRRADACVAVPFTQCRRHLLRQSGWVWWWLRVQNAPVVVRQLILSAAGPERHAILLSYFAMVATCVAKVVFPASGKDYTVPQHKTCLLYTSPSPRDGLLSRMPSSA